MPGMWLIPRRFINYYLVLYTAGVYKKCLTVWFKTPVIELDNEKLIDVSASLYWAIWFVSFKRSGLSATYVAISSSDLNESSDLKRFDLNLKRLDLERSDLERLDLERSDLERFDLERLDLECSDLERLDVERSDLERLDLDLEAPELERLDLEGGQCDCERDRLKSFDISPFFVNVSTPDTTLYKDVFYFMYL